MAHHKSLWGSGTPGRTVGQSAIGFDDYDTGVFGDTNGANSNSFGRVIVDQAAGISGVDPATIPNPAGSHPMVRHADRVEFDSAGIEAARAAAARQAEVDRLMDEPEG